MKRIELTQRSRAIAEQERFAGNCMVCTRPTFRGRPHRAPRGDARRVPIRSIRNCQTRLLVCSQKVRSGSDQQNL